MKNIRIAMSVACAVALLSAGRAQADVVECTNTGYGTGPVAGSGWSDGNEPSPGNDYVVYGGKILSTGKNSGTSAQDSYTFDGGSLSLGEQRAGGTHGNIVFFGRGTTAFPRGMTIYRAQGSSINFGNANDANLYTHHISGAITLDATYQAAPQLKAQYRGNSQHLYFDGPIYGNASTGMQFLDNCNDPPASTGTTNKFVVFTGDLSGYYGYISAYGTPEAIANRIVTLVFGSTVFPGTVKLVDGTRALLRTLDTDDTVKIGTLEMVDGSTLYPEIDIVNSRAGLIEVTSAYTRSGTQKVVAKFLSEFCASSHAAMSIPLLKVAETAGTLAKENFELCPVDAGELPEGALALRVGGDTLYLDVAAYSTDGVTDVTLATSDGSNESAFLEAYSGHWNPVGAPQPGRAYHVTGGKVLRTPVANAASNTSPPGEDIVFGGDSLVLGDDSSAGQLQSWAWSRVAIPKLTVKNGSVIATSSGSGYRGTIIDSDIEIEATSPGNAEFRPGTTWVHFFLKGTLSGAETSAMRLRLANVNSEMYLLSDCSGYNGLIEVTADAALNEQYGGLRICSTNIPGTLKIGADTSSGAGVLLTVSNGLQVANLVVNRPTVLTMELNASTLASGQYPVVATNTVSLNAALSVNVKVTGGDPIARTDNLAAAFVPVLKWPASVSADETKLVLGSVSGATLTPASGYFVPECRTEGNWRVFGLAKRQFVYLAYADDSKTNSAPEFYTARTSFDERYAEESNHFFGWNWSDQARPHADCDYYANNTLRTHSGMTDVYFQGHALFLRSTLVMQSTTVVVTNLYLVGDNSGAGSISHMHQGGDRNVNDFAPGGTRTLKGRVTIATGGTRTATFTAPHLSSTVGSGCLNLNADIVGSGNAVFQMNSNTSYPVNALSYLEFSGDNSAWTGKATFQSADTSQWSDSEHLVVLFSEAGNLGGNLSAFAYNGITLKHGATLKPRTSVAYSLSNRGIYIDGQGGVATERGVSLSFGTTVTWNGTLVKEGAGTVLFGGAAKFGSSAGDEPSAGSNVLSVNGGGVGVTAAAALDGVKAVFGDGSALVVKLTGVTAETTAKGWTNTKLDDPFVSNAADGKLHVAFDADGFIPDGMPYRVAICTVKSGAAADSVRGMFSLARPSALRGYRAVQDGEEESDGMVTFYAVLKPTGLVIMLQ